MKKELQINIIKNLNLKAPINNTTDDIQSLTKNYENDINVRKIKEAYPEIIPDNFHFKSKSEKVFHIWDHFGNNS